MKLPKQLISKAYGFRLVLLNSENISWIIQHTDTALMEKVFGSPEKGFPFEDFYNNQLSWTSAYLITDANSETYGIIRVVPEMDDLYSVHGIGWPNQSKISRVYFQAWIGIHYYLFEKCIHLKSNCSLQNLQAINVLTKTGYKPTYVNSKTGIEQNINFSINRNDFQKTKLSSIYGDIKFFESLAQNNSAFKPIRFHSSVAVEPSNYQVSYELILQHVFRSRFIQNRMEIRVAKKIYQLRFKGLKTHILIQQFEGFKHYHMEFTGNFTLKDIIIIECYN